MTASMRNIISAASRKWRGSGMNEIIIEKALA